MKTGKHIVSYYFCNDGKTDVVKFKKIKNEQRYQKTRKCKKASGKKT